MKNTVQNRQAALDALLYFADHPDKHDQAAWVEVPGETVYGETVYGSEYTVYDVEEGTNVYTEEAVNLCGTTMCVAGLAQFQEKGYVAPSTSPDDGARILGLDTYNERHFLFYDADNETALAALRCIATGDQEGFENVSNAFYNRSW